MRQKNHPLTVISAAIAIACATTPLFAQDGNDTEQIAATVNPLLVEADQQTATPGVSPARRIDRQESAFGNEPPLAESFRSIDGSGNNPNDETLGAAKTPLHRWTDPDYADGVSSLAGPDRPSPRFISNVVNAQADSIPNDRNASDFVWQWGQFLDHDLDLTDGVEPPEPANIAVPVGDVFFDPNSTGTAVIALNRSFYDPNSGTGTDNPVSN
ncbi:MAG: hypothetical protein HC808_10930 [Candidatus Competibacteraceae bacterium]|nr:hypothetical protein [Candidatus Competibacteraceae bacterium]